MLFNLFDIIRQHIGVDISQSGKIGETERLAGDRPALISQANGGKNRPLTQCLKTESSVGGGEQNAGRSCGRDPFEKLTASCLSRR